MKEKFYLLLIIVLIVSCGRNSTNQNSDQKSLKAGSDLFKKYGCVVCHSLDGKEIYGPALNNIYLKEVQVVRNGKEQTIIADREYLKRAISKPRFEKVKEYNNKDMPETYFSEKEVDILVDYLIALSNNSKE